MKENWYSLADDFGKPREAVKIEIKKFNKNNQLCYFDSKDLTCKGFTDEQIDLFLNLFSSAGFVTEVKKHTYFGIYDPSRFVELMEIYPTNEELLQREIRTKEVFRKIENRKRWWSL